MITGVFCFKPSCYVLLTSKDISRFCCRHQFFNFLSLFKLITKYTQEKYEKKLFFEQTNNNFFSSLFLFSSFLRPIEYKSNKKTISLFKLNSN